MGLSTRVVAALLFGSGFSALVYQTAWQRMFRLTFGASTAASAAVLAVFLGGLGLGGLLLGKQVERGALRVGRCGLRRIQVVNRRALHAELDALIESGQVSVRP